MRVIIAGSRSTTYQDVFSAMRRCTWSSKITSVVSGRARGADTYGEAWAEHNNIPVTAYPADWDKYGKSAGFIRNKLMAANSDALIAIWDGISRGTANMVAEATKAGLPVFIHPIRKKK